MSGLHCVRVSFLLLMIGCTMSQFVLLDANTTGNKDHILNLVCINSGWWPHKAASYTDIDFFAEDFFFRFP